MDDMPLFPGQKTPRLERGLRFAKLLARMDELTEARLDPEAVRRVLRVRKGLYAKLQGAQDLIPAAREVLAQGKMTLPVAMLMAGLGEAEQGTVVAAAKTGRITEVLVRRATRVVRPPWQETVARRVRALIKVVPAEEKELLELLRGIITITSDL